MSREHDPAKKMKALLTLSTGLAAAGDDHSNAPDSKTDEGTEERQRFLSKALEEASLSEVETLKAFLQIIPLLPKNLTPNESSSVIDDFLEKYEMKIADILMDIDSAKLFYQIGGLNVVVRLLEHDIEDLRYVAIDAVRICCSNNPYCQEQTTTDAIITALMRNIHHDTGMRIKEKAMSCLSALSANNSKGIQDFIKLGGCKTLEEGLITSPGRDKLIFRTLFTMEAILKTNPALYGRIRKSFNVITTLVGVVILTEDIGILEQGLKMLSFILKIDKSSKNEAQKLKLKDKCIHIIQKMSILFDEGFETAAGYAEEIIKFLE